MSSFGKTNWHSKQSHVGNHYSQLILDGIAVIAMCKALFNCHSYLSFVKFHKAVLHLDEAVPYTGVVGESEQGVGLTNRSY